MKKLLFIIVVSMIYATCTNKSATTNESGTAASTSDSFPFKASYSSNFTPVKASTIKDVLDWYKAWETGDMNALKNHFADSVTMNFPDGGKFSGTRDSLMYYASRFRDSLSKVEFDFVAWVGNHSVDKNEDWLNVWYKEIDTYKTGKIDSAYYQDDNRLSKDGKVDFIDSHKRVLK
ncbi:MAG TPA: nuclear transport factor 2 family protein [Chitinophagaceae bacterium]|nr:nuclear transport factor 2 family protein [Chitinophagaceae bacterium]